MAKRNLNYELTLSHIARGGSKGSIRNETISLLHIVIWCGV